jgi:hypothetical protein
MLPFGKKILAKNFIVLKYTKTLKPSELKELRNAKNIPAEVQKHLKRGGLPYIKVTTVSENWAVEFICGSTMYNFIDTRRLKEEPGHENELTEDSLHSLHSLFVLMYADCTILGDTEYLEAKGKVLQDYMTRQRALSESKKEAETAEEKASDDKVLEELKQQEETKAQIAEMARHIEEGGNNGE